MKKISVILLFCFLSVSLNKLYSQVKIGINVTNIDSSALLEVEDTSKGFLPTRLSSSQRDLIKNPAIGLTIFNTTVNCLQWHIGGNIWHDACGANLYQRYPAGSNFCNIQPTQIIDVNNPVTGKTWMDRNLGASRAAASSTDAQAYGSLYQWGRFSDGHQCISRFAGSGVTTSGTITTQSNIDRPSHGSFINRPIAPSDWRSPRNDSLWQGVNGINNPCPIGYRIPTNAELDAERLSWSSNNSAGAFASPLKLTRAGYRSFQTANLTDVGVIGDYWSSTVSTSFARNLTFDSSGAQTDQTVRSFGFSIRCIKN